MCVCGGGGGSHIPPTLLSINFSGKTYSYPGKIQIRKRDCRKRNQKCKSKEVMSMLFDVAKTLARNRLAFRGNDDDENGNFRQIVYLL